jgi:hypothetical protein
MAALPRFWHRLLHKPDWTEVEIEPLLRHGLVDERSVYPLMDLAVE